MRIRHVVNTVGPSARADLAADQARTLDSMQRAIAAAPIGVEVEVVAVRFPDDRLPATWIVDGPLLTRSVLDLGDFPESRRLPLLADLLAGFSPEVGSPWDVGVFTNIDIALQPTFYEFVADHHRRGLEAFTVNRRTVHASSPDMSFAELAGQLGESHNGHDCFVFTPPVLDAVDVDQVCVGAPGVGWTLLLGLASATDRFHLFNDAHVTFHVGNDRPWRDQRFEAYRTHNRAALDRVRTRLEAQHGTDRVSALREELQRRATALAPRASLVRRVAGRLVGRSGARL